jgi:hypothetical protein
LQNEDLRKLLEYRDAEGKPVLSLNEVKRHLFFLISKVASTNKLNQIQKKAVLHAVKKVFGFEND